MNSKDREELRVAFRRVSESYSDCLRPDSRRRIMGAALQSGGSHHARWYASLRGVMPQMAAVAALLLLLAIPAIPLSDRNLRPEAGSPVKDLQVASVGGKVVLSWNDGGRPRKVVKATSQEQLAHLESLKGEIAMGERWVDSRQDAAPIVFYVVE